jgi:outer membrane protein TolC
MKQGYLFIDKTTFSRYISRLSLIYGVLILTGCATVGPDYIPPDTAVSTTWHTQLKDGLTADEIDPQTLAAWWSTLNDPELSSLIERAAAGNLDLKKARARVREARARRGLSRADLFPTLDATGNVNRSRSSEDTGNGVSRELYSVGFDAGWELDIFGGVRRSVEASQADLEASREDLRDVLVSLFAEVALNYVEVPHLPAPTCRSRSKPRSAKRDLPVDLMAASSGFE